jgi:redox-sensitive bicupin YhaK (pirin superfamily)
MTLKFRVIPEEKLHLSEPNPISFGNMENPPIQVPFWTAENWLQSRFHFAFGDYDNPQNERFGVLRVINDDLVQPERGFATHAHRDMEIVTYVVAGELTHEDSMGNAETLQRGSVQYMTAGTGVEHSEHNRHEETPMRCIQTWIFPSEYDLQPKYGSFISKDPSSQIKAGDPTWENKWVHLASNVKNSSDESTAPVKIHQDVDCHAAELEDGAQVMFELPKGRMAYLVCVEGGVSIAAEAMKSADIAYSSQHYQMKKYDGCEITGTGGAFSVTATETEMTENGELAHVLMFAMAAVPDAGRTDF